MLVKSIKKTPIREIPMTGTGYVEEPPYATIYSYVEQNPEYPGGDKAFKAQVLSSLQEIVCESKERLRGLFTLHFWVKEDGRCEFLTVDHNAEEAWLYQWLGDRIARQSQTWRPGKVNGRPVKCLYELQLEIK